MAGARVRKIEFLTWEGCPSTAEARELVDGVLAYFEVPAEIEVRQVETQADAEELRFPGSPTIRIDGADVDPAGAEARPSLSCRVYRRPNGTTSPLPSEYQIQAALKLSLPLGRPPPSSTCPASTGNATRSPTTPTATRSS